MSEFAKRNSINNKFIISRNKNSMTTSCFVWVSWNSKSQFLWLAKKSIYVKTHDTSKIQISVRVLENHLIFSICTNFYLLIKIHYSQDARYAKEKSIFNNQPTKQKGENCIFIFNKVSNVFNARRQRSIFSLSSKFHKNIEEEVIKFFINKVKIINIDKENLQIFLSP